MTLTTRMLRLLVPTRQRTANTIIRVLLVAAIPISLVGHLTGHPELPKIAGLIMVLLVFAWATVSLVNDITLMFSGRDALAIETDRRNMTTLIGLTASNLILTVINTMFQHRSLIYILLQLGMLFLIIGFVQFTRQTRIRRRAPIARAEITETFTAMPERDFSDEEIIAITARAEEMSLLDALGLDDTGPYATTLPEPLAGLHGETRSTHDCH